MIVTMKKVSLFVLGKDKETALKKLRRLGVLHMEVVQGCGAKLTELQQRITRLENAASLLSPYCDKHTGSEAVDPAQAEAVVQSLLSLQEEEKQLRSALAQLSAEAGRIASWGEIDLEGLAALQKDGISLSFYEMPKKDYRRLPDSILTLPLAQKKGTVRFALIQQEDAPPDDLAPYRFTLPKQSSHVIAKRLAQAKERLAQIEAERSAFAVCIESIRRAIALCRKEIELEVYHTGISSASLSEGSDLTVSYFTGYLPKEDLDQLTRTAQENAWGLTVSDPTPEDPVPTKLKNNKFVSLIYPLTDFLGTVPGYFEYDISAWFLGFILVFFGIIFGDGGYGLLICAGAGIPILRAWIRKKPIAPAFLLIELMGLATVLWGILTCTWFGLSPTLLPKWLRILSLPVISNVYADRLWIPFWSDGTAALTTTQNVQILCFSLALVQLSVAHVMGMVRNRRSLKLLGDLGSIFQLCGIFYVVLSLVVNGAVFPLGLVIGGVPVGIVAIASVGIGFAMSFVFSNYEGKLGQSILASCKNIVSCLLGVVNVFSDIVSYIRLWAVGLAGAAISATVNELASPLLGNFLFLILAVVLLVFGHGLNMILNVLSVIVHGVRLNTLEFSTHLDMSWSGQKFQPFEEEQS